MGKPEQVSPTGTGVLETRGDGGQCRSHLASGGSDLILEVVPPEGGSPGVGAPQCRAGDVLGDGATGSEAEPNHQGPASRSAPPYPSSVTAIREEEKAASRVLRTRSAAVPSGWS